LDYYNSDVGGFIDTGDVGYEPGQSYQELYTQWFANSALGEVPLRPHAWAYSDPRASFCPNMNGDQESNRQNLYLRYSLFPYFYSLAHRAYEEGEPLFPPLVYEFQTDWNARKVGSVKLIGESLLYGVVVGFGQTERSVYLPQGKWLNYHSHEWVKGAGAESAPVPLYQVRNGHPHVFTLPLFIREGGIIPKYEIKEDQPIQNIAEMIQSENKKTSLTLQVASSPIQSRFNLYEDDGVSVAYLQGKVRVTRISQKLEKSKDGFIETIVIEPIRLKFGASQKVRTYSVDLYVDQKRVQSANLDSEAMSQCITESERERNEAGCWKQESANLIRFRLKPITFENRHELVVQLVPSDA
jgi:alpha-glucosidase